MTDADTIVAISTPAGVGGVAVVRLSGPQALPLTLSLISVKQLVPRRATYCHMADIDDGLATWFPAPHSYTGDDVVELSCHGSAYVQQALVQRLLDGGARLAQRGEFTMRAFANGRLNLSQAEAVADLIEATTPAQHRLAMSQLRGGYAAELKAMRQQLVDLTSLLELELDFSQEDVEFADRHQLNALLQQLQGRVARLLESFAAGNALKHGIAVAIVGSPNVGKSTLLNALLGDDRAIVSATPGTTRDTVEGLLNLGGLTFRLIDTAGLHSTADEVERQGIERTLKVGSQAAIVLHVVDAGHPQAITASFPIGETQKNILVINKCDLNPAAACPAVNLPAGTTVVHLSALTGQGLDRLKQALAAAADHRMADDVLLANVRHRDALQRVAEALAAVAAGLDSGTPTDLVAIDLRDALYHLGTITGEVTTNELLGNIFSRFCIGK